jgi:death on curing protein
MIFLTREQLFEIHSATLKAQEGSEGLRDENGLPSAAASAENRFYYEEAVSVICAATYTYHLIKAHSFVDGNKRVGAISADVCLLMNGAKLFANVDELEEVYFNVASGKMNREHLEKFFFEHVEFL